MDTPPNIRRQYASPPRESTEQRRRRLANRRAAKYRHFRSLSHASEPVAESQREQNTRRQRERRSLLNDEARDRLRMQNRRRQQLWRQSLSDREKAKILLKQRERQRKRRQTLDEDERKHLRELARLRIGRQRRQLRRKQLLEDHFALLPVQVPLLPPSVAEGDRLPCLRLAPELPTLRQHQEQQREREILNRLVFSSSTQTPPPTERVQNFQIEGLPLLPHLSRPNSSALLHPPLPSALFQTSGTLLKTKGALGSTMSIGLPSVARAVAVVASRPPLSSPIMSSVSLSLPAKALGALPISQQQLLPRMPIVLPPAHRSLPPLPDFLNSREAFNPATASASTRSRLLSNTNRTLFPSIIDLPSSYTDASDLNLLLNHEKCEYTDN
ncbi:hypothetical protein CCR75_000206 [Bremia lactucae]|uniref:Uncharacterized protein n=1 Tax=Bremia lactucae TaxID=4779 RepID=A0A976FE81_BRELC|nr:hypothetical protein CCR75_000206 [Bremia lactucae]